MRMRFHAAPDICQKIPLMSPRRVVALAALAALTIVPARALAICTAVQISMQEPGCMQGNINCTIAGDYTIEDGCVLNFGLRNVRIQSTSRFTVASRMMVIRAASLTLDGFINAVGSTPGTRGGMVVIETTGSVNVTTGGEIDVSGNRNGGEIMIRAGGSVLVSGKLQADFLDRSAGGGLIQIDAGAIISTGINSVISARGGGNSDGGGEIDLDAAGAMTLRTDLDVSGLDAGFITLLAGSTLVMQGALASGGGDAGSGGCIDVIGGAGVTVSGAISSNGASGTFMSGGCGGIICIDGGFGNTRLAPGAALRADGASPDGGGGNITVLARGNTIIDGDITARGPTGETCGGCMCVEAGIDTTVSATAILDTSGGDSGGAVGLLASRNITVNGPIAATGDRAGSLGGDVTIRAGQLGPGALTLNNLVEVSSNAQCSDEAGCGEGGVADISACNLTITPAGALIARGPNGGDIIVSSRDQLTVRGTLNATRTIGTGLQGVTRYNYRAGRPPVIQGASVSPAAERQILTTCPNQADTMPPCLNPCPVCGNGVVQYPETCDLGVTPPSSCSGCSVYCRLEECDDGLICTDDTCHSLYGCRNQPTPACVEPTPTITGTPPTATATRTASATSTTTETLPPTDTPSTTPTSSATATPSPSSSPSITPTPTDTPITTSTPTTTATPTDTATSTSTPTSTSAATPSASASSTATPSAEPTATPSCPGDCDGGGDVTVNELITGVNIALGNSGVSSCPAFDRNGDGMVSISELIDAVNAALMGC